jgi:hypothetical protein
MGIPVATNSLARRANSVLSSKRFGVRSQKSMQRLTARLLLLFALAGTFLPVALQATAAPTHACCRRASHHCHDSSAQNSEETGIRDIGCCTHDRGRALTTSHSASPQPHATARFTAQIEGSVAYRQPSLLLATPNASRSTRAPPAC